MYQRRTASATTTNLGFDRTSAQNRPTRVVGYARVSTEGQAQEDVSLDAQKAKISAYGLAMELALIEIIVDEGRSAKSLDRRGLNAALAMLSEGKADALLVTKLDRLTRSVKDLGFLVEQYFASGEFSLLSVSDSIDTRSPSGRLVLNVLGSVAQWEREAIVERTKEALAEIKAQGYRFGYAPDGYRHSKRVDAQGRRIIEENPAQQAVLRRIVAMFDRGMSVERIAEIMNAERAPKPRRGDWYKQMVYRILRRLGRIPPATTQNKPRQPIAALIREREALSDRARRFRCQGLSLREIGRRLSSAGYGPPRGDRWHASTIAKLIAA